MIFSQNSSIPAWVCATPFRTQLLSKNTFYTCCRSCIFLSVDSINFTGTQPCKHSSSFKSSVQTLMLSSILRAPLALSCFVHNYIFCIYFCHHEQRNLQNSVLNFDSVDMLHEYLIPVFVSLQNTHFVAECHKTFV